jgi:hypothetical protein
MDHLGLLLAATGIDRRLERGSVTQNLISALVVGALIVGCTVAAMVLLAAALTFAVADHVGDWISATLIAAAIFAAVGVALGLILRWRLQKTGADLVGNPAPAAAPALSIGGTDPVRLYQMAEAAGLTHPRTLWDIATLVALGFIAGLPHKAPPSTPAR